MFIDESASTCMMAMLDSKVIRSSELVPSPTLIATFDSYFHQPHGIIPTFPIKLQGKTGKLLM